MNDVQQSQSDTFLPPAVRVRLHGPTEGWSEGWDWCGHSQHCEIQYHQIPPKYRHLHQENTTLYTELLRQGSVKRYGVLPPLYSTLYLTIDSYVPVCLCTYVSMRLCTYAPMFLCAYCTFVPMFLCDIDLHNSGICLSSLMIFIS